MNCEQACTGLDEYVDWTLSGAELHELELHLAECAACRAEERELRGLLSEAGSLAREMDPPRDLWPGIAQEIEASRHRRGFLAARSWPMGLAVAATLLLATTVGFIALRDPSSPGFPSAPATTGVPLTVSAGAVPDELQDAEREYARATAELMGALEQRRAHLPEATVASVEENLRRIDIALAEVRTALRVDPTSQKLTKLLTSTHRHKVELLQRVVRLSQKS